MPRVVVVGGGPAGAAVALLLARQGLTTTVLEARREPETKVGECLPPNVNPLLERLGLSELMRRDGHLRSYGNRSVWGSPVALERDFIFGTAGAGWQLDRRKFEESLAAAAVEAGADWRRGHRLAGCSRQGPGWRLSVNTPRGVETIDAEFVVEASGRAARLGRALGARRIEYDRLVGAAVFMKSRGGEADGEASTLVESVATGWWYSARLPGGKLIVVYMTDGDLLDHRAARRIDGWLALLKAAAHTSRRVAGGDYLPLGASRVLAANNARLSAVTGDGWLAVGDAAASHDPLSSYGISSAMATGFYAASAIADFLDGGRDALPAYAMMVDRAYAQYLLMHHERYLMERRWPGETFWRRRHAPSSKREALEREASPGARDA